MSAERVACFQLGNTCQASICKVMQIMVQFLCVKISYVLHLNHPKLNVRIRLLCFFELKNNFRFMRVSNPRHGTNVILLLPLF